MPRRRESRDWFERAAMVSNDPAASVWLKTALTGAVNRDPVNAAGDAQILQQILQLRADAALQGEKLQKGVAGAAKIERPAS